MKSAHRTPEVMTETDKQLVVLIDDDRLNNMVCEKFINLVSEDKPKVVAFTDAERGLDFVHDAGAAHVANHALVFLDLNMPDMSGWDFLAEFAKLEEETRKSFTIFIVSSSLDPNDHRRAAQNPYVKDFVVKPLTADIIKRMLN